MCERSGWSRRISFFDRARTTAFPSRDPVGLGVGIDQSPGAFSRMALAGNDPPPPLSPPRPPAAETFDGNPWEAPDNEDDDLAARIARLTSEENTRTPLEQRAPRASRTRRRQRPTSLPLPTHRNASPSPTPTPASTSPFRQQLLAVTSAADGDVSQNPFGTSSRPIPPDGFMSVAEPGPAEEESSSSSSPQFSYKTHFKRAYLTEQAWLRGPGRLLNTQISVDDSVVTSLGFDGEWIVVGMATSLVHVFESSTGQWARTLRGHELGVWCLTLVSKGGGGGEEQSRNGKGRSPSFSGPDMRDWTRPSAARISAQQASVCGTARGWGQEEAVVVTGSCDRDVRVWNVKTGECTHVLHGHTSTIRCLKVLDGRPIAVSGSRDATLRVWDIENGRLVHLLVGHQHSVRCIEVSGNKVVSGSYDATCRVSGRFLFLKDRCCHRSELESIFLALGRRHWRVPVCLPRPL
jgi:hypothetical protein